MKKIIFGSCVVMSAFLLQSCGNNANTVNSADSSMTAAKDTTTSAMKSDSSSSMMSSTPLDKDDSEFAMKAADGGMMEVALGQVAQQNGMSQRVKDFGSMMVNDHTAADNKLKALASSKNLSLPASISGSDQKEVDKLSKKTGKDFDKDYMNMMLDDHKKDIKDFQKEAASAKDADLKNFVLQTLPTLQTHLDSAIAITGKK
jgi:putative membrane protein